MSKVNKCHTADAPSGLSAVLGFLIPIVGLILYLVWKKGHPMRANSAGKGALTGIIFKIITFVLLVVALITGWIDISGGYRFF